MRSPISSGADPELFSPTPHSGVSGTNLEVSHISHTVYNDAPEFPPIPRHFQAVLADLPTVIKCMAGPPNMKGNVLGRRGMSMNRNFRPSPCPSTNLARGLCFRRPHRRLWHCRHPSALFLRVCPMYPRLFPRRNVPSHFLARSTQVVETGRNRTLTQTWT